MGFVDFIHTARNFRINKILYDLFPSMYDYYLVILDELVVALPSYHSDVDF